MIASSSNFEGTHQKKAVIVGLDGVPCSLLQSYMKQGVMPHFKEMVAQGHLMPMRSTLPEVSSVAWASFMTGSNAADHGIFGFMEIDRHNYEFTFPNFNSLKVPTFWEKLGVRTVAFNIPQTYPARAIKGVLVSGFVAPDLKKAVHPPRIYNYFKTMGYRLDVRSQLAMNDPEAFFEDLFQVFEKRIEAVNYLFTNEDWQIFIATITETDRLHHFFFDSAEGGPYHDIFLRFYQKLDKFLWELFLASQKSGAIFLTCSDHGFAPIKTEVYINSLLKEHEFLNLAGNGALKGITATSRAFGLEPARIYLHLKEKYARGPVMQDNYQHLREELKTLFESLTYEGNNVVKKVFFKEEIYSGSLMDKAPDLYVLAEPGFDLKAPFNKDQVFGRSHFQGAHTYHDAHLFISEGQRLPSGAEFSIRDIHSIIVPHFS